IAKAGFDGWEEASWELDLRRCDTDQGAAAFAKERVALAKGLGLEIFTVATHLQGQALGDEPSVKTLQFLRSGCESRLAYKSWRDKGAQPPPPTPYTPPEEGGTRLHADAPRNRRAGGRCAGPLRKLRDRRVPLRGFAGSRAHWGSHFFLFPPLPDSFEGH